MKDEKKKEEVKPFELSPELKGKFKMRKGFAPGKYAFRGYQIDTSNCSLEDAKLLHEMGFDVIEEEKPSEAAKVEVKKP